MNLCLIKYAARNNMEFNEMALLVDVVKVPAGNQTPNIASLSTASKLLCTSAPSLALVPMFAVGTPRCVCLRSLEMRATLSRIILDHLPRTNCWKLNPVLPNASCHWKCPESWNHDAICTLSLVVIPINQEPGEAHWSPALHVSYICWVRDRIYTCV